MFLAGRTILDVCVVLGISEKTFYNWKDNYFTEEILQSIGDWKKSADDKVESALYRRATGTVTVEDKAFMTKGGTIKTVKLVKELPADVNAARYWLNNRKSKDWKEKIETKVEHDRADQKFSFNLEDEAKEI